jgi:uncharacterized protein YbcC (UPF0753/DUF2309 family)
MSTDTAIRESIETAAESVGSVWPLHSFVTANPLSGFEDQPFHRAVENARELLGGDGYPSADVFRQAWEAGRIDTQLLEAELDAHGYPDPEASLAEMAAQVPHEPSQPETAPTERVDAVLTKWLSAFLDQGQAEWSMPNREDGFYEAFCTVAQYDSAIPSETVASLPEDPIDAIRDHLDPYPVGQWREIFEFHFAALPGWTGYLKQRLADDTGWQRTYPITLTEYLAVRLTIADACDAPLTPPEESGGSGDQTQEHDGVPLAEVWLSAWEATYRSQLVESISDASESAADTDADRPDAQLVFCIDTRSEIIRRHIEAAGDYETHGYAGFFGVPMRYTGYNSEVSVDACPPILDPQHSITERPTGENTPERETYTRYSAIHSAGEGALKSLKSNAATAFSFVESTGLGYGAALAARTLLPSWVYDAESAVDGQVPDDHEFCEPSIDHKPGAGHDLRQGLTLDEKVEYAATAFELMGWEEFARLVVFTGHASQTTNNPFDSSLDCGACAGNPGGPSARVLAAICNESQVRTALRERGIDIPADTVFVAGEHNTTTDEIELFDGAVPESHEPDLERLREALDTARASAAEERVDDLTGTTETGARETQRRAADWAETRPEWGLAGNAGFVIGPRALTQDLDLDGRAFLHSYDWTTDPDGDALTAIMTGPMVVTQWINTQYYFSTVDNAVYGSGSKVTQNPIGNVGVYQGNGGDLMTGLPSQSLMSADDEPYHQPLRLSTVVHAPVDRVTEVLSNNADLASLLDNNWLSLTVVDPQQDHRAFHYEGDLNWRPVGVPNSPELTSTASAADD